MALATLSIDLEARLSKLQSGMDKAVRIAEKDSARMERSFDKVRSAAASIGGALVAGLSVRAVTQWINSSIDAADAAIKQARSVGLLVEDLTALQFAADLSGVSQAELATGLTRLARTAKDAGDGVKASAEAFDQLGIKVKNADGSLKGQNELLDELADAFSSLPDGIRKTALAQEIFGRSGAKLISLLNGGAAGLKAMKDEAAELGLVIGTDAAEAAERLNDNILRLQKRLEGLRNTIAQAVVPILDDMVSRVVAAQKTFSSFADFLTSGVLAGNNFNDAAKGVQFFTDKLRTLRDERAKLGEKGGFFDAIRVASLQGEIKQAEKLLEFYQRVASATGKLGAGGGRGFINPAFAVKPANPAADPDGKTPKSGIDQVARYLENLQKQLQATQDLTVAEAVLADIRAGRLGKVNAAQEASLVSVAREIDAANDLVKATADATRAARERADARNREYEEINAFLRASEESDRTRLASLTSGAYSERLKAVSEDIRFLNEQYKKGRLDVDLWADAVRAATDRIDEAAVKVTSMADELGLSFSSAFEDAIVNGKGLREVLQGIEADILRIVTRKLVTEPLAEGLTGLLSGLLGGGGGAAGGGIGGILSSIFGSLFGGFFATGGFLAPGKVGVAGERGPELIFGGRQGLTVQPNGGGGGQSMNVYNNFQLAGTPDRRTLQQVYAAAARGVERASSRNN